MSQHRFGIGQNVALVSGGMFKLKGGAYRVLRLLANDGVDLEYHVKHVVDGHERMVRQSEILGEVPGETASG